MIATTGQSGTAGHTNEPAEAASGLTGTEPSSDCAPAHPYSTPRTRPVAVAAIVMCAASSSTMPADLAVRDPERAQQAEFAPALHDTDRQQVDEPDGGDHRRDRDEAHHDRRERVEDGAHLGRELPAGRRREHGLRRLDRHGEHRHERDAHDHADRHATGPLGIAQRVLGGESRRSGTPEQPARRAAAPAA